MVIQSRVTRIPCSGLVFMPKIRLFAALAIVTSTLSACGVQPQSWGEWNSIIVATSEDEWNIIGEMVETTLEARVFTVRAEKTFRVTHQVPALLGRRGGLGIHGVGAPVGAGRTRHGSSRAA